MPKTFARIVVIRPKAIDIRPPIELSLNILGIQMLLEQEGICHDVGTVDRDFADATTIIVADVLGLTEDEQRAVMDLADHLPLLYVGVPLDGPLKSGMGLERSRVIENPPLRVVQLPRHAIAAGLSLPEERNLKIKYAPHLADDGTSSSRLREAASVCLHDGRRMGPAVLVSTERPRKVVIPFALGQAAACQVFKHGDLRFDLDLFDYPLHTTVDSLRTILRNAILWANPDAILLRPYYWPVWKSDIPHGCFCLNHDLCGYRKEGLVNIKAACRKARATTTFFDFPPFRLKAGEPEGHDVAIHVPDSTPLEKIVEARAELGKIHSREIRGWRRHGPTYPENWPGVWQRMEEAGIKWSTAFGVQTMSWTIRSEGTAQANRLPARVIDGQRGRRLNILEIPSFDSEDAERLSDIHYGPKLDWPTFHSYVTRRLDFAARHNLMAGYLIHGWTAGVAKEADGLYGALDGQRMMREVLRMAKERQLLTPGHEWVYDWWTWRERVRIAGGLINLPSDDFAPAIEFLSASKLPAEMQVGGRRVRLREWPVRRSRMLAVDPGRIGTTFQIEFLSK
ncbi:MAG: hypothetical protein AB1696_05935 [Planctomycetota bacterium]